MSKIMGLPDWLNTPPGAYMLAWERVQFELAVSDVFGYHALQLGLPELDALQANRMPHKWLALPALPGQIDAVELPLGLPGRTLPDRIGSCRAALFADSAALPFPESSLDMVTMPHTLELCGDPHSALREVARVLVPEGRVVISGFNPASLWGLRQKRDHLYQRFGRDALFLPSAGEYIGYWRLRDWLRLLDFEVESAHFGCYRPALGNQKWLERFDWMDRAGKRWWPIFGAVYFLVAVKHVQGMRLLESSWKTPAFPVAAPAIATSKDQLTGCASRP